MNLPGYGFRGPRLVASSSSVDQIDHCRRTREAFHDLLGQQKRARLNFALLKQGTQEPGLQLDGSRFGHL